MFLKLSIIHSSASRSLPDKIFLSLCLCFTKLNFIAHLEIICSLPYNIFNSKFFGKFMQDVFDLISAKYLL